MNKDGIERMCRMAGMRPERRERFEDYEIFVADGFSVPPHHNYRKFGVEPTDFPFGMFTTLWWISRDVEKLDTGQPLFFDAFHDSGLDQSSKKIARINTALKEAAGFIQRRAKLNA